MLGSSVGGVNQAAGRILDEADGAGDFTFCATRAAGAGTDEYMQTPLKSI